MDRYGPNMSRWLVYFTVGIYSIVITECWKLPHLLSQPGPSVFDLSVSGGSGDLKGAGGGGKTKTENKRGPAGPGPLDGSA